MSKEINNQNRVAVLDKSHPIHSIDGTGGKVQVGNAQVRMYEGESVFRNSVLPQFETEETLLKPTKNEWTPLDHYDAVQPILDAGWEMTKHNIARGGLVGNFVFTNPNLEPYDDIFDWDGDYFPGAGRTGGLMDMIMIDGKIQPGGNHRYRRGIYRLVCTNGMVAEEMQMGDIRMNFDNFSLDKLHQEILHTGRLTEEQIRGERVGTAKGSKKFFEFLEGFILDPESTADLPTFAKKLVQPLETIPTWTGMNAINQFYALSQTKSDVHHMDVVNAWTGAINMPSDTERGTMGVLRKVDALARSTADLIGVYSI